MTPAESARLKFTSANGVPIERATLTRAEFDAAIAEEREACARVVEALYAPMCACDAPGRRPPHRMSCEAGVGDDVAEAIRQRAAAPSAARPS
jgi:hypothetical protein